jgi:ABC-type lipoprotein release transport system permease subunit
MALGVQRSNMLKMVILQGLKLGLIGIAIGVLAALAATAGTSKMLIEVKTTDPITFVGVCLLLVPIVLAACAAGDEAGPADGMRYVTRMKAARPRFGSAE